MSWNTTRTHNITSGKVYVKVLVFLRWARFLVVHVAWNRQHVFVNMDETQLASVKNQGTGMISRRKQKRADRRRAPRDAEDRHHTKVTYMAAVSDSPELQPLLPQVILPRYTQHACPPPAMLHTYADFGHPFEFWHGTAGATSPGIVQTWMTRLRSVISSFNDRAWIILTLDCDTNHLSVRTMAHLRRLGMIPLLVPAKLTWLLQLLDVFVFGLLKKDMRLEEVRSRESSTTGSLARRERMGFAASSIRRIIINRDWSAAFDKVGHGNSNRPSASHLQEYLPPGDIEPALPTLAQFADLISRPAHTEVTQRLHRMCMRAALDLVHAPLDAVPPAGADIILPGSASATPAPARADYEHQSADDVLRRFLHEQDVRPPSLSGGGPARNVFMNKHGRLAT